MKKKENVKKGIKNTFFLSVNKDIEKYRYNKSILKRDMSIEKMTGIIYGPEYDGVIFKIDLDIKKLIVLNNESDSAICSFNILNIFEFNIKVWFYVRKLKNYFKQREIDRINLAELNKFKSILTKLEGNFVKEIRRDKLNKIK